MMALEQGIVWGADVVMMQEQYVEREGYNISHPGSSATTPVSV